MFTKQKVFDALVKATENGVFPLFVLYVESNIAQDVDFTENNSIIEIPYITAGSFINGNNQSKSLLNSLNNKLLYIPDFAVCMEYRRVYELSNRLLCAYDGEITCLFGNNIRYHWKGRFNLFSSVNRAAYHYLCLKLPALVSRMVVFEEVSARQRNSFNKLSKYFKVKENN